MLLSLHTTTFGAYGGIPTYNRLVARVLNDFKYSGEKRILVLTDQQADLECHRTRLSQLKLRAFSGKRLAFLSHVLRLAFTRKLDLVLIGHVNYAPLGLVLKILQPRLRYGVMVHGTDVWSRLSFIKRHALRKAHFVTSVSLYTQNQLVQVNGVDKNRVYLLPNTLEWEMQSANEEFPALPPGVKLLAVCRLDQTERYKGVDTVIEAMSELLTSTPDLHFYVIGHGTDLERHKNLADKWGVAHRVQFLGSVDTPTLRAYYRTCDIFVMPSDGEGFGIVFLEAMHHRKPVIAARSRAVPEVVEDEVTGLLVEYGNVSQLSASIKRLCKDKQLRKKLGDAGYDRLNQKFSFAIFQEKLGGILYGELPSPEPTAREQQLTTTQSL